VLLAALLFKDFMRVSWAEMDEIDQAEDDEAEFVFAEMDNVKGQEETEEGKAEWQQYRKMGVMERAESYAKKSGIRRTGTFHMKVKEERQKNLENNTVIEETKTMLAEAGSITETKSNSFVPSKLEQVPSASMDPMDAGSPSVGHQLEEQMVNHMDLSNDNLSPQPNSEEEPLSTHAVDGMADDGTGDDDVAQHGYTETVVVKPDGADADDVPLNGGDGAANIVREDSP